MILSRSFEGASNSARKSHMLSTVLWVRLWARKAEKDQADGRVSQAKAEQDEAEQWFRNALDVDSTHALGFFNLGYILDLQGRFDEASENYKLAIQHDPKLSRAYLNLGILQKEHGNWPEGNESLQKAYKLDPNVGQSHGVGKH
jgi:tetratricopeptide (TPR) repeat protein